MEEFTDFENLDRIKYYKQYGYNFISNNKLYFREKDQIIRMYDESNVIKKYHGNYNFINMLSKLNVEGLNTPYKILALNEEKNDYYIISKFINNAFSFSYYIDRGCNINDICEIFKNLFYILEDCHNNNLFLVDINLANILINEQCKPVIVDYDTSCFIKNNNFISDNNEIDPYMQDELISGIVNKYFKNIDLSDYNNLRKLFVFIDKMETLIMFIEYFLDTLQINYKDYEYLDNYDLITKIGLPKYLENKIIMILQGTILYEEDYLIEDINSLESSRFSRKRKFR